MKTFIRTLCLSLAMSLTLIANAQLVNCNPDPNGEPWITGGLPAITPEILTKMEAISPLELTPQSRLTVLPTKVDNSQKPWFRPVFNQGMDGCCGQAAGIGYALTYEINRIRNLNANVPEHQYPTHFTWNYLNEEFPERGSWYFDGWEIVNQMGVPTVEEYGGMYKPNLSTNNRRNIWISGYDEYYNALSNKVVIETNHINTTNASDLEILKHWINDHGTGSATGGLACFAANSDYNTTQFGTLPVDSDDAGKRIIVNFGTTGYHAWTIVGYNDDVKFDFNGDGEYTNPTNNMAEWEIGALKVVNSWGQSYCDGGFVYVPYRLLVKSYPYGISPKRVHVVSVTNHYEPQLTLKMNVTYSNRRMLTFYADYASNANQNGYNINVPYTALNWPKLPLFDTLAMQGLEGNNDPIEFCLDFGQFFTQELDNEQVGKVFFVVYDDDSSDSFDGEVSNFSLVDYRWNEVFELPYPYQGNTNTPIVNNGYTRLGIPYHLIPFEQPIQNNLTLTTDRVARRMVRVNNQAELSIDEGVRLDMYGTDSYDCILHIDNGSTLTIADNAVITAKRGDCVIEVFGNIRIGDNVTFKTENGATLTVKIRNQQDFAISNCHFIGASLLLDNSTSAMATSWSSGPFVTVENCSFTAFSDCDYALKIINYARFLVLDNTVNGKDTFGNRHFSDGVLIYNSGMAGLNSMVSHNSIKGCTGNGLMLFGSVGDVRKNEITECGTGVMLLNGSTVNHFMGNCGALSPSQTQYIHDNDNYEVYVYRGSMPQTFRFNYITSLGIDKFFVYEDNVEDERGINYRIDLEYNNWGNYTNNQIASRFQYITNTNNTATFDYLPKWEFGECLSSYDELAQQKSNEADSLLGLGNYSLAKQNYKEIVTLYPNTNSALNAMKKLLVIEDVSGRNYAGLQHYYENDTTILGNENLTVLAGSLANKCDEMMERYDKAIAWYEAIIEDESTPYNDSVFAVIDLGYLYLRMDANGEKGTRGKLDQFIPKSADAFAEQVDYALGHLKTVSRKSKPSRELPEQYWVDIVTEQPESYVVDADGNVHLYSAEALAWLISAVNGINGQEADNFNGRKVTLEANVDMSAAIWTAIADRTEQEPSLKFCGTLDGNGFVINGLNLCIPMQGYAVLPYLGFLGNLCGARVENIVLRHAYAEGRCDRDGKFFANAETLVTDIETRPTYIDRCYVEFDEIYKDSYEKVCALFGYQNNGFVTNCVAKVNKVDYSQLHPHELFGLFMWNNYGTIQNCASIADSLRYMEYWPGLAMYNMESGLIENCYSYIGDWFGDLVWWPEPRIPRMGICWENYGSVKNCYYNTWSYHNEYGQFFDDEAIVYNYGGEINETMNFEPTPFFQSPYWELKDSVNVTSQTGNVYRTNVLGEALLDWVLGQENSEDYNYWCYELATFMPNKLPVLCDLDITNVREEVVTENLSVYPNPAKDIMRIKGLEPVEVKVYNTLGQLVKTVQDTNEVSVVSLPTGVYLMRIVDVKGIVHIKRISVIK